MIDLVYNLAVGVVDLLALWLVVRRRSNVDTQPRVIARLAPAVGLVLGIGGVLAMGLGEDPFGVMRLACWGLFVHAPAWAIMVGVLLWRQSRRWAAIGIASGIFLSAVAVDAFFIEPRWLEVTHVEIYSEKLTQPFKIVVIADFQTDAIGAYERQVLREVQRQQPDMVLWAGDYLQERDPVRWEQLRDQLRELLESTDLQPRLGTFAVGGNVDNPRWPEIFAGLPVHIFSHNGQLNAGEAAITGLAVGQSFRTQVHLATSERFHIVLGHCPNFALGEVEADLLVAGHVHGGQVRLPGIGPLITNSRLPRTTAAGVTKLPGGSTLVVSRGIGMERSYAPRLRLFCRPELTVIHALPRHSQAH